MTDPPIHPDDQTDTTVAVMLAYLTLVVLLTIAAVLVFA